MSGSAGAAPKGANEIPRLGGALTARVAQECRGELRKSPDKVVDALAGFELSVAGIFPLDVLDELLALHIIRAFSMRQRNTTPMSQCHHPMH